MTSQQISQVLRFPTPTALVDFLLTCQQDDELQSESNIYRECLDQIYLSRQRPEHLFLRIHGPYELVTRLVQMAVAGGGKLQADGALPQRHELLTIARFLRRIMLRPATTRPTRGHLLVALWGLDSQELSPFLRYLWDLGAKGLEVAFIQPRDRAPSHLIWVEGIRHVDAFHAWRDKKSTQLEIYTPLFGDRRQTQFCALWGHRSPVPGLDRLVRYAGMDMNLVLVRPTGPKQLPEWITFERNEVNFFRKPAEVVDVVTTHEEPVAVELREDRDPCLVPLELAIVPKPRTGPSRIWQIDKEIDRRRRGLRDLEETRARLVSGEREEVYFAYRFNQQGADELHPLLIRLLQQRLGVLNRYSYAHCQPADGAAPYHLVIADRPQTEMGFSLQLADQVYYQPAAWRRWGVNLFLPLDMELAPRIEVHDAAQLLQRFLEKATVSASAADGGDLDLKSCPAILWEPRFDGAIVETRVRKTERLLDQYKLLNTFQRNQAREVEEATRQALLIATQAARDSATTELDGLERELLEFVDSRSQEIEASYRKMEVRLNTAGQLVATLKPQVEKVTAAISQPPADWVGFVNQVVAIQRDVADPSLTAYDDLRRRALLGRHDLRALAARGRDLVAAAEQEQQKIDQHVTEVEQALQSANDTIQKMSNVGRRAAAVLAEVTAMHGRLGEQILRIQAARDEIARIEQELAQIETQKKTVQERLQKLRKAHADVVARESAVVEQEARVKREEKALVLKSAELGQLHEVVRMRALLAVERLRHMEQQLERARQHGSEMEQLFVELEQQTIMVDAHAVAVDTWERHRHLWEENLRNRREDLSQRVRNMDQPTQHGQEDAGSAVQTPSESGHVQQPAESIEVEANGHVKS